MDIFTFDVPRLEFSYSELAFLAIFLVSFFVQLFFYLRYYRGIIRKQKRIDKGEIILETSRPPVSVIICARDEESNLKEFLPLILTQDYPEYEVIVVDDGSYDNTPDLLKAMSNEYPHLRTSFIPQGTKNISTKKLGISIGVKAAKNNILLFTDADCKPDSNQWIASMVNNFHSNTEFVLGYGGYYEDEGFLNRMITYDTLFIGMQYMGMAFAGIPYMGVGRNMAYKKSTFERLHGFSSTLGIASGDDDLMIQRGATKYNTEINISSKGTTWSVAKKKYKNWIAQKERHLSVSGYYKPTHKFLLALEPFSRGLFYLSIILIAIFGNIISIGGAVIVFLVRWLAVQMPIINKTAVQLNERRHYFTIPLFDIYLPLVSLNILLFKKNKKMVWK